MKQIIVIRNDLNMRKGKMVAQGAHASMAAVLPYLRVLRDHDTKLFMGSYLAVEYVRDWFNGPFTKICVRVDTKEELLAIIGKAIEVGIPHSLITDNGKTEFSGVPTVTCGAVGPAPSEIVDALTGHLKLL